MASPSSRELHGLVTNHEHRPRGELVYIYSVCTCGHTVEAILAGWPIPYIFMTDWCYNHSCLCWLSEFRVSAPGKSSHNILSTENRNMTDRIQRILPLDRNKNQGPCLGPREANFVVRHNITIGQGLSPCDRQDRTSGTWSISPNL